MLPDVGARRSESLRCANCDTPLPVAVLVGPLDAAGRSDHARPLAARDLAIGKEPGSDVVIPEQFGVSGRHARLAWRVDHFEIRDAGSVFGTTVNGRVLSTDQTATLASGDVIGLGDTRLRLLMLYAPASSLERRPRGMGPERVRGLASLDPWEVVRTALALLKEESGTERALLIDVSERGEYSDPDSLISGGRTLLTPLSHPMLQVSKSSIVEAVSERHTVSRHIDEESKHTTRSMNELGLRRVWVHPLYDHEDRPLAAVYLDSPVGSAAFDPDVEASLLALVAQIGAALRNAILHQRVVVMNQTLDERVRERTRELEDARARWISQDRLVTLGRLVAGIAHELNNPAGAIVSLAGTLRGLLEPVLQAHEELARLVPDEKDRHAARALLDASLAAADRDPSDSRARRELEASLAARLGHSRIAGSESIARRFARIGLDTAALTPALGALHDHGAAISEIAERLHTFGRSLRTVGGCAADIARIVDGLKTYAHLDRSEAEVADVHRGIHAALAVLAARIPRTIEVVTRFEDIPPFVHRPGELTQVWTNLIDNAVRAMGERGVLTLATHAQEDQVHVSVADTGPGIPPEIVPRIFELHVTTRGSGAGLGFGLPICRTIIEQHHGGHIRFETGSSGTTFTVVLPLTPPATPQKEVA